MTRSSVALLLLLGYASNPNSARADTYALPDPISPTSTKIAMIGAMVMGADVISRAPGAGRTLWTRPTNWLTSFQQACSEESGKVRAAAVLDSLPRSTELAWFSELGVVDPDYKECNPRGVVRAFTNSTTATGHNQLWRDIIIPGYRGDLADAVLIKAFKDYHSPIVVPIYGSWDHWVTVTSINDIVRPGSTTPELLSITAFDALALPMDLLGGRALGAGIKTTFSMGMWRRGIYYVLNFPTAVCESSPTGFGTCSTSPYNDTYYNDYVVLLDPPPGVTLASLEASPHKLMPVFDPPALVPAGQMDAMTAQKRVFEAIRNAHNDKKDDIVRVLASGQPDTAVLVHGLWPSGEGHNYYLVPVRNSDGNVMAFVQLDAADGAFEEITTFTEPLTYHPVESEQARSSASSVLSSDEQLTRGTLTWNPRVYEQAARHSFLPYYEFGIVDTKENRRGVVRVARYSGKVLSRSVN